MYVSNVSVFGNGNECCNGTVFPPKRKLLTYAVSVLGPLLCSYFDAYLYFSHYVFDAGHKSIRPKHFHKHFCERTQDFYNVMSMYVSSYQRQSHFKLRMRDTIVS